MQTLLVGDPLDKNTDIGAINSKEQLGTIQKYLKIGRKKGRRSISRTVAFQRKDTGASQRYSWRHRKVIGLFRRSIFFKPALSRYNLSELLMKLIDKANNTPSGFQPRWTDKGSKIFNLTIKLRAGVVWANTYNKFDPTSPFGGYKESGYGREGGLHGLLPYVKLN